MQQAVTRRMYELLYLGSVHPNFTLIETVNNYVSMPVCIEFGDFEYDKILDWYNEINNIRTEQVEQLGILIDLTDSNFLKLTDSNFLKLYDAFYKTPTGQALTEIAKKTMEGEAVFAPTYFPKEWRSILGITEKSDMEFIHDAVGLFIKFYLEKEQHRIGNIQSKDLGEFDKLLRIIVPANGGTEIHFDYITEDVTSCEYPTVPPLRVHLERSNNCNPVFSVYSSTGGIEECDAKRLFEEGKLQPLASTNLTQGDIVIFSYEPGLAPNAPQVTRGIAHQVEVDPNVPDPQRVFCIANTSPEIFR